VVRATETDFAMVECFDPKLNQCRLSQHCSLKNVLSEAMQSYLAVLDGVTLADLIVPMDTQLLPPGASRLRLIPGLPV
jgi:Rrf2 family nitric oxide-sensitive transcriptional repressor